MTDKRLKVEKVIVVPEDMISVVELLSDGYSVAEIAEQKNINKRTLESRLNRLRSVSGCKNLMQLACSFLREKIIE